MNATAEKDKQLVPAAAIARRYNVTPRCVYRWAEQGLIEAVRIGKTVRFDMEKVIEALEGKEAAK